MLANNFAESQVTVKKDVLLKTLQANLETHKKDYEEALTGFKEAAKAKLEEHLELLNKDGKVVLQLGLTVPVEYSKEYNRVIKMLEMSTADEIIISESQFNQYVMDDWNWKGAFTANSAMYANKR